MMAEARSAKQWDVVVIGGGATGLGTAVDAASRGLRTLLLERDDFAKGTSSRSTKLVHGGVRYLRQGQVGLVMTALRERSLMVANAPHLVHWRRFVVPCRTRAETMFYGAGLKLYDLLALGRGLKASRVLSKTSVLQAQPGVRRSRVRGGVAYYDGQFDDARYALALAQTCAREGGTVLNYCRVDGIQKEGGRVSGVVATDLESGQTLSLRARCVVNATGVFVDQVRQMDQESAEPMVQASQGVHVVLDRAFLPGDVAMMVPRTDDGRVLFAIPWKNAVLLGTTDTPIQTIAPEPLPLREEVDYLIDHAGRYLERAPTRSDVRSIFVGLRPLIRAPGVHTRSVPREHSIRVSDAGLVTVTGGKWTTYRYMAQQVVDRALRLIGRAAKPCVTKKLRLHGWTQDADLEAIHGEYGEDRSGLLETIAAEPLGDTPLHPRLPYSRGQIVWSARNEMARTVEDVLARRTRSLFLDARASIDAAASVAALLARELGRDADWESTQVDRYTELARQYLLDPTLVPQISNVS